MCACGTTCNYLGQLMDERDLTLELEQFRTALEESLGENARLVTAIARQRALIDDQGRELFRLNARLLLEPGQPSGTEERALEQGSAEEELRVAFEELQVMTEELEVANASLQQVNRELDSRVETRTRELASANTALRESESGFRAFADVVPDCLWRMGRTGQVLWYNQRWYEYTGIREDETLGEGWLDVVHPADRPAARIRWATAVGLGSPYMSEHRVRAADGRYRWFLVRAEPVHDERGELIQWFGSATDVHDQRVTLEAFRESELRFRTLAEGMPQLVWRSSAGGKWTWSSPQWMEYTGQSREASLGRGWLRAVHPDDRSAAEAAWASSSQTVQPVDFEGRIYCKDESRYHHFRTRANPARSETGRVIEWLGTCTDVDDLLQMQARQEVMMAEVQHRTRNLLAVVRSIATQTLRTSASLEAFGVEFNHRLEALSRVQGMLSRSEEQRITIGSLVRMELDALGVAGSHADRIVIEGPDVPLRKSVVQTLALALHELATNARKHGALNGDGGQLRISWRVYGTESGIQRLAVDWHEQTASRVAAVVDAVRSSFGRQLIESALPYSLGAKTQFDLTDSELRCSIDLPLERDRPTRPD